MESLILLTNKFVNLCGTEIVEIVKPVKDNDLYCFENDIEQGISDEIEQDSSDDVEQDKILALKRFAYGQRKNSYIAEYDPSSDIYANVRLTFHSGNQNSITENFYFTQIREGNINKTYIKKIGYCSILVGYEFNPSTYINDSSLKKVYTSDFSNLSVYYIDVWIPIRFI